MRLPKNITHIHLIAICGTGMGSLAGLLTEAGYSVSGSDQNTYPPMSTQLEELGIKLYQGFKPENLKEKPDLIVVGNAVSRDNPEVEEMLRLKIPYVSMPEALSHFFIQDKKSIVVAGTHGKTTTAALASHLLRELGADPSCLIGGVTQDGEKNYCIGKGDYFVIEGDEYDTAFFDKGPKFLHYKPYYTIITSLEFDHADIYRDLEHFTESFEKLVGKVDRDGVILVCGEYERLMKLVEKANVEVEMYGIREVIASDSEAIQMSQRDRHVVPRRGTPRDDNPINWQASNLSYDAEQTSFDILHNGQKEIRLESPLAGRHNVLNTLVCYALLRKLGYLPDQIQAALKTFKGIKRRQEIVGRIGDVIVIDDFAHHPTAVRETIDAVKKRYPQHDLWAIFEPRSNTSIRSLFQDRYAAAFGGADQAIIADVFRPEKVKDGKVLDVDFLVEEISRKGTPAKHISGVDTIVEFVVRNISSRAVILIMSNGGFGGIHGKIVVQLSRSHALRGNA